MKNRLLYILSGVSRLFIVSILPVLISNDLFENKVKLSLYILMLLIVIIVFILSYRDEFKKEGRKYEEEN